MALIGLVALSSLSSAQFTGFNIDYGTNSGTPSATYGAGSGQAGFWNNPGLGATPVALNNLSGSATSVTVSNAPTAGIFSFDNPGTTGDDQTLYDDVIDVGGAGSSVVITVSGLGAGPYLIYTYAWAPDDGTFISNVSVNGLPVQPVGGPWPGTSTLGVTFALHPFVLGAGDNLNITVTTGTGFGSVNGVQIVPVPEPTSLALVGIPVIGGMIWRHHRGRAKA